MRISFYGVKVARIRRLVLSICLVLLQSGCGTFLARVFSPSFDESFGNKNEPTAQFYIGTRYDLVFIYCGIAEQNGAILMIADVPFSFIADTLYLPADCYYLLRDCEKSSSSNVPQSRSLESDKKPY